VGGDEVTANDTKIRGKDGQIHEDVHKPLEHDSKLSLKEDAQQEIYGDVSALGVHDLN
jgi:hypothetical protein